MKKNKNINDVKIYEDTYDLSVLPNIYLVARLDGRCFSSLTKKMKLNKPFDDSFQEVMCNIIIHIMQNSGFNILYGYTESDEISFLFDKDTDVFNRRTNKLVSTLASIASSVFTFYTKQIVSFDCRISHLPTIEDALDYFHWRQHDASRNALIGYCYWTLRKEHTQGYVNNFLSKKNASEQQEILFQNGINYNDIPSWQKQGTGFYWIQEEKVGFNPLDKTEIIVKRNKLYKNTNLSYGQNYSDLLNKIITKEGKNE